MFIKNWCDYVFLFTGSLQVWSSGNNCGVLAPHLLYFNQLFVLTIYATFFCRILLFCHIKFTALHHSIAAQEAAEQSQMEPSQPPPSSPSSSPSSSLSFFIPTPSSHLLSLSRALLDIINGGFYCAGPLDTARPATPLDLRSLPTIRYKRGLAGGRAAGEEDTACIICMMEFEEGEELRLLYCRHFYHQGCVDQWLMRNATCPQCRASVDKEKGEQMVKERRERRERRRRRREMERQRRRRAEDEDEEHHHDEVAQEVRHVEEGQTAASSQESSQIDDLSLNVAEMEV